MIPVDPSGQDPATHFLRLSATKLRSDFLPRLSKAFMFVPEADLWTADSPSLNSPGNILLHMEGNLRQWIIAGVGGAPDARIREAEFSTTGAATKEELLASLHRTVEEACAVIGAVGKEELLRKRHIQAYDVTALEAVYHAVEHFSYHLGQVIQIAKRLSGRDLRLYPF